MKDNYIEKSCHDETIAVFGKGVVDGVIIENNTIKKNRKHDKNNAEYLEILCEKCGNCIELNNDFMS